MPYFSVPAFMLVILAAASTFWSIDIGRSMAELPKYFLYFLSFWILSRMVDKQRRAAYFIFLLVAGAMMAYSLYEYAFLTGSGTAGPTFPFASPEPFVAFALVLFSMSLGMLMSVWLDGAVLSEEAAGATHIAVLVVSAATALLSSAALLLSSSAMTLLLGTLILVAIVLVRGRKEWLRSAALVFGVMLIGLLFSWLLSSYGSSEARTVPFLPALEGTVEGFVKELEYRAYHWVIALKLGAQRFVGGFGLGTFKEALPLAYVPADFRPGPNAQSFAMQLFAELGILGFASFLALAASVAVSLARRVKRNDKDALALAVPFVAVLISLFIGGGYEAPVLAMLFFMFSGMASAERHAAADVKGRKGRMRLIPTAALLAVIAGSIVLCSFSMAALTAKQEAEHYMDHGEYVEAVVAIDKALDLNSYDKDLYMAWARAEMALANDGVEGHSLDAALRYAEIAVDLSPYSPEALAIRGSLIKAMVDDDSWLEDFKQASAFAADDVSASLTVADEGLRTGDLGLAGEYIDIARLNEPLLSTGADVTTLEGISDLSNLIKVEVLAYVHAVKSGDTDEAEIILEDLKLLEEEYPDIHGFIHELIERYGVEDPLH